MVASMTIARSRWCHYGDDFSASASRADGQTGLCVVRVHAGGVHVMVVMALVGVDQVCAVA